MLSPGRPVVYRCNIVGKKATNPSPGDPSGEEAQEYPFPAWPEIKDAAQPYCLAALEKARYWLNRCVSIETKRVAKLAEKYILRQKNLAPEIQDQARAFVKAHAAYNHFTPKLTNQPAILLGLGRQLKIGEHDESTWCAIEAGIQALIYGNLNHRDGSNFYGVEEAFAFVHEYGHWIARILYSGVILDKLSREASEVLCALTAENLPPEEIILLWARFNFINKCMSNLAEKFEPIEEIYANYIGLRLMPREVRDKVEARVKEDLAGRNWLETYEAFAKICDTDEVPTGAAGLIFETVCRTLDKFDNIDSAKLLQKFLEILPDIDLIIEDLEQSLQEDGIDIDKSGLQFIGSLLNEVKNEISEKMGRKREYESIAMVAVAIMRIIVIPHFELLNEAVIHKDLSHDEEGLYPCAPEITLIGWESGQYLSFTVTECGAEYKRKHTPIGRIFFESLRQQLSQYCAGEGHQIVCPFSFIKVCCGYKDYLRALHENLPEEDKKHFRPPHCNRPFVGFHDELSLHPQPIVSEGKLVSLEYTLTLDDKSVVESNVGSQPLTYTHGSHQLIPGLEKALEGLTIGASKQVTVPPADAYGEADPKAVQEVQKQLIPTDALKVGMRLQGKTPSDQMVYPLVSEIKADTVVLDFNHPLAGKTLYFDVKVVDIRHAQAQQ